MSIVKSITIENFKGIREPVKFDLAPIVLLYGPNSAGKSTLLQALAYLNDVIVHDECNNEYTRAGGESMYLGKFVDIVNGHDITKNVRFTFEIDDLSGWDLLGYQYKQGYSEFIKVYYGKSTESPPLLRKNLVTDGLFINLSISWDACNKQAFLSCCRFIAQGEEVMRISVKEAGAESKIKFNFSHPSFKMDNSRYVHNPNPKNHAWVEWTSLFDCITHENSLLMPINDIEVTFKNRGIFEWPKYDSSMGWDVYPNLMRCFMSEFDKIEQEVRALGNEYPLLHVFALDEKDPEWKKHLEFIDSCDGIEALRKENEVRSRGEISEKCRYINELFETYFSTVINGSFELIGNLLKSFYIGPLRKRPDSEAIQQQTENSSWHDGMVAWQLLNNGYWGEFQYEKNQLVAEVNEYLGGPNYFNSGYHIKPGQVLTMQLELTGELQKLLEQQGEVDLAELKQQLNQNSQFKKILKLHDIGRGVDVDLTAVGTGISQIVPIITALILEDVNVIMVEQPELHIHPRMQVQLGELIVNALMSKRKNNEKQKLLLIETHSEALLLRLMRRIREPSEAGHRLKPEDLAVYYVDMVDGGTKITKRIEIDADGDFIDGWPGGFFEEAYVEKFAGR